MSFATLVAETLCLLTTGVNQTVVARLVATVVVWLLVTVHRRLLFVLPARMSNANSVPVTTPKCAIN